MSRDSQFGLPHFIDEFRDGSAKPMTRISLSARRPEIADYDEAWLQQLIMRYPRLLPVDQIERAFANLVPICMELKTPSGYLDNLLVTPSGDIALVECKLWRNPEARREVVGQIIDYAKDFSAWDYVRLEEAIRSSKSATEGGQRPSRLYDAVSAGSETDESAFIDAVSRNLRRGRFLLLIVGDGIREGVEGMSEFLQQYAGLHFTLAIVELALFKVPTGGFIAQPRVLARTTNIDRGIVTVDEKGRVSIGPARIAGPATAVIGTRMSITKEQYLERLEENLPGVSERLNEFAQKLEKYGVYPEFGTSSMILRWPDELAEWSLGLIGPEGRVYTDNLCSRARELNLTPAAIRYIEKLAALDPRARVRRGQGENWGVAIGNTSITVGALLADGTREQGWLDAIGEFQNAVMKSRKGDWQEGAKPETSARENQVVLEVGSEGGSLTLLGEKTASGDWEFRMNTDETTLRDALSEEDRSTLGSYFAQTGNVRSFEEGIRLLDRYPWFRLHPLQVHPEFVEAVLREVRKRGGPEEETRWRRTLALRHE